MSRISQVGALAALEDYDFISDVINKVKLSRNRIADIANNNIVNLFLLLQIL